MVPAGACGTYRLREDREERGKAGRRKKREEKERNYGMRGKMKKFTGCLLTAALTLTVFAAPVCEVSAKTNPSGQTVDTVLFYVENSSGQQILASQIPVSEMAADLEAGKISQTVHNYSLLDRYVTTVHQEAQGFTVGEFVDYAKNKSTVDEIRNADLTFTGQDSVNFWEIDQTGYDDMDSYTYEELYGVPRYNFPQLYRFWDYRTQDYYDPDGEMTREEVIDYIFENGEPEVVLMSVKAFSSRYIASDKYGTGDYNMENAWNNAGLLDTERTIRVMKPMTEDELRNGVSTAADTRYWAARILLEMDDAPDLTSSGTVAQPQATMTEDGEYYYIRFSCSTPGATVYYNSNYDSASYAPTSAYGGTAVKLPKSDFPSGTVTMTAQAVKEGCADAGVVTLTLKPSGTEQAWTNPYSDVSESNWYYENVKYVTQEGLFDAAGAGVFGPDQPMTRSMLVTALYRLSGSPAVSAAASFNDVPADASYADAVAWAYANGVVNGTSAVTFDPQDSITREQIAAMFYRYAQVEGADTSASAPLNAYSDASSVSAYAADAMSWCVGSGLVNGMTSATLAPKGTATRAQAAAMVQRFAEYTGK